MRALNYDNMKEGTFDYSTYIDESLLIYLDLAIDEETQIENELLFGSDNLIDLIDIIDQNNTSDNILEEEIL